MVAQLVPPIVLIALMFCVRHSRRSESRNALKKDRAAALASARKLLEKAKLSLEKGDVAACADQIWQSVSGYFCATFDLAPGEFNAERVSDLVTDAGLSAENTSSLRETMQTCEQLRFDGATALDGRESDGAGLATAIRNIEALMKELDKKL
jgi:hypothetical protein